MKSILYIFISLFAISTYAQNISALYQKLDSSVVIINVIESKTSGVGDEKEKVSYGALGSGVLFGDKGEILTAAHVVNGADYIEVILADGQKMRAKVTALSKMADVAIIKVQGHIKNPKPAKLGDSDKTKIGAKVMVIGSPMGLYHSLSVGYISRKEYKESHSSNFSKMEFFQTDAAINSGNSGGPMFNMDGEVIGVVSSILSRSGGFEGIGFAATINIIKELLIEHNNTWLGIDAFYLEGSLADAFNVKQQAGILVQNVTKNSPAYFMGLKGGYITTKIGDVDVNIGGDIILEINGYKLDSPDEIGKAVDYFNALEAGDKYTVKVLRKGELIDLHWKISN